MTVDQEVTVRAVLVLADAKLRERPRSQRREAALDECAKARHAFFAHPPVTAVRIERGAVGVVRDLEAARLDVREAVIHVAAVEIRPAGQGIRLEAQVAVGRRDEGDLLARHEDPVAQSVGKHFPEPRSARVDDRVARLWLAIEQDLVACRAGRCQRVPIFAAAFDETAHQFLHGAPRHQSAEPGLVQPKLDAGEIDLRPARGERGVTQNLERQIQTLVHVDARARVIHELAEEEQHAVRMKQRQRGLFRQALPFGERAERHARIDLVGAVIGAREPAFAAGRSQGVGRPHSIHEQHAPTGAPQMLGGPRSEHAGADYDGAPTR